jgi:hypothetical protein
VDRDVLECVQFPTQIVVTIRAGAQDAALIFTHFKKSEKNKTRRKEHERVKHLTLSYVTLFL